MEEKKNPLQLWWYNLTHVRKNYKKVRSSPYASLLLALKLRKIILVPIILLICWRGFVMIRDYRADGFMGLFGKLIMLGILLYIVYRLYRTVPQAKRQIEYYKKYPHTINYCPTDVKEDVKDIIAKIKENKKALEKKEEENKNSETNIVKKEVI